MMQHIWIFQLSRALTPQEKGMISQEMDRFLAQWKSHGAPVPGEASFPHDHFLIVQAVPGTTSGCSIDAMTKGVEGILSRTSVEVLGPDQVFFREKDGAIAHLDFRNIKAAVLAGRLTADSTVFDASMGQGSDLRKWEVPLSATWMSRFLLQTA
jgi:hypothetical protein